MSIKLELVVFIVFSFFHVLRGCASVVFTHESSFLTETSRFFNLLPFAKEGREQDVLDW